MSPKTADIAPPHLPRDEVRFDDIVERLDVHGRDFDHDWLRRVYDYATTAHGSQRRRSGEPYITHPIYVAYLLADMRFDPTSVAVGLLHDVLEDTGTSQAALAAEFGEEIADLVDGVSKIGRHEYVRRDEAQAETFRKLMLASARDLRVILVKLADRLHNMLTLEHMEPPSRRRVAQETLEIYAPLAHRLGMSRLKGDMEDLAFYHLHPKQYAELRGELEKRMRLGRGAIEGIRDTLGETLREGGIEAEISFRVKRYYSIHQKLQRRDMDLAQLFDYLAFRAVTETLRDTYAALGVVHQNWRPIPGRFKDYIAVPKPNLYQSLHTTVVGPDGQPFEVQIRTRQMDLVAEEGVAAHWRYKEGKVSAEASESNVRWLRQLLDWQRRVRDPRVFLDNLKMDLYTDEVYVFTPRGDVHAFPRGATPLDFAYRIHTDLGHHCSGARINGKLQPLRTELRNGDMVEIETRKDQRPSRDWLKLVKTSRARSKVRQWLNAQQRKEAVEIGRRLLEQELRKFRTAPSRVYNSDEMRELLRHEGMSEVDDLLSRIGFGKSPVRSVVRRLLGTAADAEPAEPGRLRRAVSRLLPSDTAIRVRGEGDLLATIAQCCSPVPGEPIVGFVTRGRGVSVHSVNCSNVKSLFYHPEREIEVEWAKEKGAAYPVVLRIETDDQPGVLARLTEVIAKQENNIRHIESSSGRPGHAFVEVVVDVGHQREIRRLKEALMALPEVSAVVRDRASRKSQSARAKAVESR